METDVLIQQLAGRTAPVRRLASPWRRTASWLAISAAYAVVVVLIHSYSFDHWQMGTRFAIEQGATLATAVAAAIAAFWSIVPGASRRWLLVPAIPLAVWLATLGEGCVQDWLKFGSAGITPHEDWDCLRSAALIGIVPAIVIVAMLRRGAPLVPNATLALAAVAVAAFANFVMRLHHYADASIVILLWHLGSVFLLAIIASLFGRIVLRWRHIKPVQS